MTSRISPIEVENITLPKRRSDTHKGDYGKLLLFCGGRGYTGAGTLMAYAAVRSGAGVVYAAFPESVHDVYAKKLTTCVLLPLPDLSEERVRGLLAGKDALALGPGLGLSEDRYALVRTVLSAGVKAVLDADALTLLSRDTDMLKGHRGELVLTPHPKEFSRLTGASVEDILKDPAARAAEFAQSYNVTLLLKGAATHIATPDGRVYVSRTGSPAMAKGGSGDVLCGTAAGFAAQGFTPDFCARAAAYLCGRAGERAAERYGEYSATPLETARCLISVIKAHTEKA